MFKIPLEAMKKSIYIISLLLTIDALIGLGTPYLQSVEFFSGKSGIQIMSDLVFLEGAIVFCIGAFWAFLTPKLELEKVLLMITGAGMMGLSVVIGVLFL